MAVTMSRPRPVSTVPSHMSGALVGLLSGHGRSAVALCIEPQSGRNSVPGSLVTSSLRSGP